MPSLTIRAGEGPQGSPLGLGKGGATDPRQKSWKVLRLEAWRPRSFKAEKCESGFQKSSNNLKAVINKTWPKGLFSL